MSFVLHHTEIGDRRAPKVCYVLHGVLGSGNNFRTLIKGLASSCPQFRFLLVDLRLHGRSLEAPPPHTLQACAADLARLAEHDKALPAAVIGHSLGGKVALAYAERQPPELRQVWVLDSYPGAHAADADHEVVRVVTALCKLPGIQPTRERFVDGLVEQGLSLGIAHWLSQNLIREADHYRFRLDLGAISQLLTDYFDTDLWSVLENPPNGQELHLVIAERSQRLGRAAKERLGELSTARRINLHTLPNAGHWLHVDNPEGLLELLSRGLEHGL